jgi:hypothetical protein
MTLATLSIGKIEMDCQIHFRCRANPALAGISFTRATELDATKARLEGRDYEIIWVQVTPRAVASQSPGTAG